jgi:hypothetical protein
MEATFSFETSADSQRTTRRYIPEDRTLLILSLSLPPTPLHRSRLKPTHVII